MQVFKKKRWENKHVREIVVQTTQFISTNKAEDNIYNRMSFCLYDGEVDKKIPNRHKLGKLIICVITVLRLLDFAL